MRSNFSANVKVQQINAKISEKVESLTRKTVTLGFEADTSSSWENGIVTKLADIPFSNVGDGTKSIITAELALRGGDVFLDSLSGKETIGHEVFQGAA